MGKLWSYSTGEYGAKVRVYERTPGGPIYVRTPDGSGGYGRRSLRHRDRDRAKKEAAEVALAIQADRDVTAEVTLGRVLELYHRHHVDRLSKGTRDRRASQRQFWLNMVGANTRPAAITRQKWQEAAEARLEGRVDHEGRPVPAEDQDPVRAVTVNGELKYLRAAMKWAADWRIDSGGSLHYLISESPVRGFELLKQKRPRRPVASMERYERLRDAGHTMQIHRNGGVVTTPSYFPEILDLVMGTNRRIMAIASLRYEDVVWRQSEIDGEPYGAIWWRAESDKQSEDRRMPMTPMVRAALLRTLEYDYVGGPDRQWVFPGPDSIENHIQSGTLWKWLRDAEVLAGLEHQEGGGYHQFRRLWASRRRGLPELDVAEAGGWADVETVRLYQQVDAGAAYDTLYDPAVERIANSPEVAQKMAQESKRTA